MPQTVVALKIRIITKNRQARQRNFYSNQVSGAMIINKKKPEIEEQQVWTSEREALPNSFKFRPRRLEWIRKA
ncbi:hypothetical protein SADUNF_Sadunf08G0084300 [Salix dunnii]|uniref:Uncharacterized protein n=1 Tax=Salix dunnii TaxID=1413687 RepID=A0A835MTQ3_9ROSI|nr:hypothetical protein SADUNF_Sadunf08G0084300 [Salix dunnii]